MKPAPMTELSPELVEKVARAIYAAEADSEDLELGSQEWSKRIAIAALNASTLADENAMLRALISEEHIERLANDIAIACVDCLPPIKEARHRAMIRLGERLRKPLSTDLRAIEDRALSHKETNR